MGKNLYQESVAEDKDTTESQDFANVFYGYILPICAALVFMGNTLSNGLTITKILVAPRLYLIEEVSRLVR